MKRIILIAFIAVFSMAANAQLSVVAGAGYSPKAKSPTAEMFFAGTFRQQLVVAGGIQTHIKDVKSNSCLFQARLGYQINQWEYTKIIPYIGVSQFYKSADNKELNIVRPLYAIEINQELNQPGGRLYVAASLSGKIVIISTGIRFSFLPD